MSKYLTKDEILAAHLKTQELDVPEWGGTVIVSEMSGTDRDIFEISLSPVEAGGEGDMQNIRARLVAKCLVDEEGNRLFTEDEITLLGKQSAKALDRVFDVAKKMAGIGDQELKDAVKN